ncbi:hypothetical protein F443_10676 [Phytophthora nicotianae P1569]|uniref:Uncharacterized protein n=1 Tax=Phytophthora nicotianae P1569 TaxID=1317065 RepID=V9EZD1_PHYNI|nr:hypothetical protein F443_10676 [Phytophthora nicotianae P1569]
MLRTHAKDVAIEEDSDDDIDTGTHSGVAYPTECKTLADGDAKWGVDLENATY